MRPSFFLVNTLLVASLIGCGPVSQDPPDYPPPPDAAPGTCVIAEASEVSCFDGEDNDCDGIFDCNDSDCSAQCNTTSADAAVCEEPVFPGDTLAIPDVLNVDFESSITIDGFDAGQTLTNPNHFLGLCVTMEHSWLRDLQIELDCPSGTTLVMQAFRGRTGGEIYMGEPNDNDGVNPTPGTGWEYCWTPTAARGPSMTEWADGNLVGNTLPAGDYQSSDPFSNLVGCELNGRWTVRVIDDWAIDNGFIFGWTLAFDPEIAPECLIVIIE